MSRRKQSKPRAVLKHGTTEEDNLLDPKDEILTDIESDEDDQNFDDETNIGLETKIPNENKNNTEEEIEKLIDKPQKSFKHLNKNEINEEIELEPEPPEKDETTNLNNFDDDEEDIYDDDDIGEIDNEDANSSDSFYSDLYSTHTSSTYSPSMSEGAATPNSLLHHSHLIQSTTTTLHNNTSTEDNGDGNNRLRSSNNTNNNNNHHLTNNKNLRRRRQNCRNSSTANDDDINEDEYEIDGSGGGNCNDGAVEDDINEENLGINSVNERIGDGNNLKENLKNLDKRIINRNCSESGNNRKITTKLRKIDKESTANNNNNKSGKLTGNGNIEGGNTIKNGTTSDGSYQCQFCDKSFPRLGYLKKHEQSHAEHLPFKCDYCARLFKHKRSRDRHTKLHTGDRRYRCPHCEAAFSRSDHLKIHMKTHDNQKPFQCTVCNRGYNTAAALTSHMQNHKKQAALLGTGLQPLNYSPRSTGSGSSNGSYNTKRRYATVPLAAQAAATAAAAAICDNNNSPTTNHIGGGGVGDYNNKRQRSTFISCIYCTKSDFTTLDQLNNHIQIMHEHVLVKTNNKDSPKQHHNSSTLTTIPNFQLNCEYCTMKFPNIPTMFQHMRAVHIDRLSSPNSYFENFNRLAASGTFSPRLITGTVTPKNRFDDNVTDVKIKREEISPNNLIMDKNDNLLVNEKDDEQIGPTDLSQPKKRAQTPFERRTGGGPITDLLEKHHHPQQNAGAFLCNQCNAALPDFETFRNHLKSHIAQGMNLVCHHCGLTLRDQNEYERHTISHFLITNSEFSCANSCQKTYSKTEDLQKHLYEAHVQIMYKCSLCSDLFDTKVAIQVHFACAHSNETKIYRCSACMEQLRTEKEFTIHVKTRHQTSSGSIQCMFCRAVCSSELEMHFHLAAHARQFRCPSCPETFHVEFLLDRHMQTHHSTVVSNQKDCHPPSASPALVNGPNQLFLNAAAQYAKQQQNNNNNNNILDYHAFAASAAAAAAGKGIFKMSNSMNGSAAAGAGQKFYSPLQVDTNSVKHPGLIYGLGQRYFDAGKSLLDTMYNYQQEKSAAAAAAAVESAGRNFFVSPRTGTGLENNNNNISSNNNNNIKESAKRTHSENNKISDRNMQNGFSCGICERNDFRTETEVHSHRKIVHNLKTGVSLRCAYCSGNFKSRSELEHHMKTCHNSTGKHKCLICDEIFPSPAILAEHKLQHSKVGQSGKCSHCSVALNDVLAFKSHLSEHNVEGQIPVQCICCRQTLNSDFEIGLHAKFHTKSSGAPENACALCLEAIPITSEAKVCEKCCRKHNLSTKFTNMRFDNHSQHKNNNTFVENRCNLCKIILPHAQRLQEHLVEHTFVGCEERGYSCYICSAVFTIPAGLLNHMSSEHGQNARPYDCNLCTDKFFFRAELDNHLIEHENKGISSVATVQLEQKFVENSQQQRNIITSIMPKDEKPKEVVINEVETELKTEVKMETIEEADNDDEEEEYIEVEKVAETIDNVSNNNNKNNE